MRIEINIPIIPKAKQESRSFAIDTGKKNKHGKPVFSTRQYKGAKQSKYEQDLASLLLPYRPDTPIDAPVVLGLTVYLPMPQYILTSWRREAAEQGIILPDKKPDLSNFFKNIEDVMSKLGFWRDDCLIVDYLKSGKRYSVNPRWEIVLQTLDQPRTKKEYLALKEAD